MSRIVRKIVTFTTVFGAFLLLPSTSQAGSSVQVEFAVISTGGSANGGVDCTSETACQFQDPMFGGAQQPAIVFDLGSDQTLHLEFDLYDGLGCDPGSFLGTAMGDLSLPAGHIIIYIGFNPPLDTGTMISGVWRAGDCPDLACADYTIGSDPGICQ